MVSADPKKAVLVKPWCIPYRFLNDHSLDKSQRVNLANTHGRTEELLVERIKNLAAVGMLDYVMKSGKRGLYR